MCSPVPIDIYLYYETRRICSWIDLSENGEYSSCILTDDKIYLSGISALTLKKRAEDDFGIEVYNRDRDN